MKLALLIVSLVVGGTSLALLLVSASVPARTYPIDSFQRTADPQKIVVVVTAGLATQNLAAETREDDTTIKVAVRGRDAAGIWPAVGIPLPVTVFLREPLGERTVVDAWSGRPVRDLGQYQSAREPPIDLGQVGVVEKYSFRESGGVVDLRWSDAARSATHSLAELRGSTVVVLSRTSFSGDAKVSLLAIEDYLASAPADKRTRIVVVVITLNEDPARAAVARPSGSFRPLVAYPDVTGPDAPDILRFTSVPALWFVGPDGTLRERIVGRAVTRGEIAQGFAAAR